MVTSLSALRWAWSSQGGLCGFANKSRDWEPVSSQSTDTSLQKKYNSLWIELCHSRSCFWMSVRVTIQSLNAYNPSLRTIIPEIILAFLLTAGGFHLWPGFFFFFACFLSFYSLRAQERLLDGLARTFKDSFVQRIAIFSCQVKKNIYMQATV